MAKVHLSELSRRIGRDKALVSRWVKRGTIPKPVNGLFDEDEVRRALKGNLDPARRKPLTPPVDNADTRQSSTQVSASPLTVNGNPYLPRIPLVLGEDEIPKAEDYRTRDDLPADPFLRGVIYALHRACYDIPVWAAQESLSAGAPAKVAYALQFFLHYSTFMLIEDVTDDAGLKVIERSDYTSLPAYLVPPAFGTMEPDYLAVLAGEPENLRGWEAWRAECEELEQDKLAHPPPLREKRA
jgi:hypothetical protein